jgi:hypothetical protein
LSIIDSKLSERTTQGSDESASGSQSPTSTEFQLGSFSNGSSTPSLLISNPQEHLLEVRPTTDRGLAVFALRKVKAGTLILAEQPLILLSKVEENDSTAIEREYSSLSRPDQKVYLKLFDAEKSRMSRVVSIYYSNCYNIEGFTGTGGSAIGALASRINHSCLPNVQFSFHEPTGQMRFFAIKDIPRGKEVTGNYDKVVFEGASRRQAKQMMYYGFHCQCEACAPETQFWTRSDERRRAMLEAVKTAQKCEKRYADPDTDGGKTAGVIEEALEALLKLEELLLKEGLVGVPLANNYRSLAKWAERKGDSDVEVRDWKIKELQACVTGFGRDAQRTREIEERLLAALCAA